MHILVRVIQSCSKLWYGCFRVVPSTCQAPRAYLPYLRMRVAEQLHKVRHGGRQNFTPSILDATRQIDPRVIVVFEIEPALPKPAKRIDHIQALCERVVKVIKLIVL